MDAERAAWDLIYKASRGDPVSVEEYKRVLVTLYGPEPEGSVEKSRAYVSKTNSLLAWVRREEAKDRLKKPQ